jgi:hypothetical protein
MDIAGETINFFAILAGEVFGIFEEKVWGKTHWQWGRSEDHADGRTD